MPHEPRDGRDRDDVRRLVELGRDPPQPRQPRPRHAREVVVLEVQELVAQQREMRSAVAAVDSDAAQVP